MQTIHVVAQQGCSYGGRRRAGHPALTISARHNPKKNDFRRAQKIKN